MVTICACDSYHDIVGNEIIGKINNCRVIFKGKNSRIVFKGEFKSYGNGCTIILGNNCNVEIGSNFQVGQGTVMFFRSNSRFFISDHASLGNYCHLYFKGSVIIGDHFCMREYSELRVHGIIKFENWVYIHHHVMIYVPRDTKLICGNDVGFSWYSTIITGSGHSTFDLRHRVKLENMNNLQERSVILGNHIWIGCNSLILNDVEIGNGSIVGAGSVVYSGSYGCNNMITGNPAKIISNITWDRRPLLEYDDFEKSRENGEMFIERPSFYDEFSDEGILDDYYKKSS